LAGAAVGAAVGVAGALVQPMTNRKQVAPRAVTSRRGVTRPNVLGGVSGRPAAKDLDAGTASASFTPLTPG
jgi:hypothetical protein